MKPELGGEIRDRSLGKVRKFTREPFLRAPAGTIETFHSHFVFAQKIGIARRVDKPLRIDIVKKLYGIVLIILPEFGVKTLEKEPCAVIPTPFQVVGQLFQALNSLWYV